MAGYEKGLIQNISEVERLHPELKEKLLKLHRGEGVTGVLKTYIEALKMSDGTVFRIPIEQITITGKKGYAGGRRTLVQQKELMRKGQSFVNDPYSSFHMWGLAVDLIIRKAGYGRIEIHERYNLPDLDFSKKDGWYDMGLVNYLKNEGLEWGGDWEREKVDSAHFQLVLPVPKDKLTALKKDWWKETYNNYVSSPQYFEKSFIGEKLDDVKKALNIKSMAEYREYLIKGALLYFAYKVVKETVK